MRKLNYQLVLFLVVLVIITISARGNAQQNGTGLLCQYFPNTNFGGLPAVVRVDPTIAFNWYRSSPDPSLPSINFSAHWMGKIEAPFTGSVLLFVYNQGGVTLSVGGQTILSKPTAHSAESDFAWTPALTAGKKYDIDIQYTSMSPGSALTIAWFRPGKGWQIVPKTNLYPVSPTPTGLSATPEWVAHCPVCSNMPMAHIVLAWNASPGAATYNLYRDGTLLQSGLTAASYVDMAVVGGQTYSYQVSAVSVGGESPLSTPVSTTAPNPPNASLLAPTNLAVKGIWQSVGTVGATDSLTWDKVPGATSYTVYQYDVPLANGITGTSYVVPVNLWFNGLTYTVTAVDSQGNESSPSAVAEAQGIPQPGVSPGWVPAAPQIPHNLTATAEFNAGVPRIHVQWQGHDQSYTYAVYRDGKKVKDNLWGLNYYDTNVLPGSTHSYTVTGCNVPWITVVESAPTPPVTVTALNLAPASGGKVQITGIVSNDDSAKVSFLAVPGAVDYRAYNTAKPGILKYSGGSLSVEVNGLDPVAGGTIVVEAVDKYGPFVKMDGMPVGMVMMNQIINGQGDPSNLPNVIAASAPFHVDCAPLILSGNQVFLDNFRNSKPFTPVARLDNAILAGNFGDLTTGTCRYIQGFENDKWSITDYWGDLVNSRIFVMSNHFMDTLYDGGAPRTNIPIHNNNASLVMSPKQSADISNGRVLHVTFEVDAHFNSRRWCEVVVAAAGDPLVHPAKLNTGEHPTVAGNEFRWQMLDNHHVDIFRTINGSMTETNLLGSFWDLPSQRTNPSPPCTLYNGDHGDLDKRHKFDLYLSQNHYRIFENGVLVRDADLTAATALPFTKASIYFVHQVYHTANDRGEMVDFSPFDYYWYDYRPFADERHWDNMGFEVLNTFPVLPAKTK